MDLLDVISANDRMYCRLKSECLQFIDLSVEAEYMKCKKSLQDQESLLRQVKLMQCIRQSGEESKLLNLIEKWKNVTRQVIRELHAHSSSTGSLKGFVKKLGLQWDELDFSSEDSEEESEELDLVNDENRNRFNEEYNDNYNCPEDSKRIKYEEY